MLSLSELVRIYVCLAPTDMRKSFDSLAALVRDWLGHDPLSGHLFVFRSRRGDRVKLLWWDRDGLTLYYRRLEEGTFRFPTTNDPQARSIEVSSQELSLVLWGIDPASVKRQKRYQRAALTRGEKILRPAGTIFAVRGVYIGHEHGRLASARSRPAARRPGGAEAVGRAVAGRVAEGQRASGAARAPHAPAAEKDLRQHEREVRSAAGRVVRSSARRGRDCPEHACAAACRVSRFPRTATGTAAGGFPTRSSARKSSTI